MKAYIRTRIAAGRDEEPDHRRARRAAEQPRRRDPRRPAEARLRPARLAAAVRRHRGRRGRRSPRAAWYWSRNRDDAADGSDDGPSEPAPRQARRSTPSSSAASTRSSPASMLEKLPVAFLAGLALRHHALRAAARARLPLGRLGGRGRPARRAGRGRARRDREHPVHRRVHGRLRRARRRRGGDRERRPEVEPDADRRLRARRDRPRVRRPDPDPRQRGRARAAAARAAQGLGRCCSAARSPSARRRASAPCSPRSSCSPSSSGGIARGVVLLLAYSLGLGAAFVLAGVAFAHAMRAFRWVRSHYQALRIASGATLIVARAAALLQPRLVAPRRARPAALEGRARHVLSALVFGAGGVIVGAMATILLVGVDLFLRGKLEALLPGHHVGDAEGVDPPDLVICDVGAHRSRRRRRHVPGRAAARLHEPQGHRGPAPRARRRLRPRGRRNRRCSSAPAR